MSDGSISIPDAISVVEPLIPPVTIYVRIGSDRCDPRAVHIVDIRHVGDFGNIRHV